MSKSRKNKAVALKYNVEEDTSPVVIASGYGTVAEKIIDIAEKKGDSRVQGRQRSLPLMHAGSGKQYSGGTL